MYSLYLALITGFLVAFLPTLFEISSNWTALLGIITFGVVLILRTRWAGRAIMRQAEAANAEMQRIQSLAQRGGRGQSNQVEAAGQRAIELLKGSFEYEKWQVGASYSLNAQLGILMFSLALQDLQGKLRPKGRGKLKELLPYLEASLPKGKLFAKLFSSLWPAWARLAVCYYKLDDTPERALGALRRAVDMSEKEAFLWCFYGWMLQRASRPDDAERVLAEGLDKCSDERLSAALSAVQNRKQIKLKTFGQLWLSMGLEKPKSMNPQLGNPRARMRGAR